MSFPAATLPYFHNSVETQYHQHREIQSGPKVAVGKWQVTASIVVEEIEACSSPHRSHDIPDRHPWVIWFLVLSVRETSFLTVAVMPVHHFLPSAARAYVWPFQISHLETAENQSCSLTALKVSPDGMETVLWKG